MRQTIFIKFVIIPLLLCANAMHGTIHVIFTNNLSVGLLNANTFNHTVSSYQVGVIPQGVGQFLLSPTKPKALYGGSYVNFSSPPSSVYILNNFEGSAVTVEIAPFNTNEVFIAVTPDGKYLCAATSGHLSVIDLSNNTIVSTQVLPGVSYASETNNIAISPVIYGTDPNYYTGFVTVGHDHVNAVYPISITSAGAVTIGTSFPVGNASLGNGQPAYTPNGSTVYIPDQSTSASVCNVYPVNASSFTVGAAISLPAGSAGGFTYAVIPPNGLYAYVTGGSGSIYAINLSTHVVTTLPLPFANATQQLVLSPDGSLVYGLVENPVGTLLLSAFSTTNNTLVQQYTATIPANALDTEAGFMVLDVEDGTLDTTFGNQGITLTPVSRADTLQSSIIQTGDKILITGTSQTTAPSLFLAQYTSSGILDTTFPGGAGPGYTTLLLPSSLACAGNALALDASNNILPAGYAAISPTSMLLARYTSAGMLDTTFPGGHGPGYTTLAVGSGMTVKAMAKQSNGQYIVGGTSVNQGVPAFTLARFNTDGTLDTTFGPNGTGYVINNFGNISVLNGIDVSSLAGDLILAVGTVDNQLYTALYDNNGNLQANADLPTMFATVFSTFIPSSGYPPSFTSSAGYAIAASNPLYETSGFHNTNHDLFDAFAVGSITNAYGVTQSLLIAFYMQSGNQFSYPLLALDGRFNNYDPEGSRQSLNGGPGYVIQPFANGSEYYSIALQGNGNILTGGYTIGNLANQLTLANYMLTYSPDAPLDFIALMYSGYPNPFFNNGNPIVMTLGENTATNSIASQSTGNIITSGTTDGTFFLARFIGSGT